MEPTAAFPCCRECRMPLVIFDDASWMVCGTCKLPYATVREALICFVFERRLPGSDF